MNPIHIMFIAIIPIFIIVAVVFIITDPFKVSQIKASDFLENAPLKRFTDEDVDSSWEDHVLNDYPLEKIERIIEGFPTCGSLDFETYMEMLFAYEYIKDEDEERVKKMY